MRFAPLAFASLLVSTPAFVLAQGMDLPTAGGQPTASAPAAAPAPAASPAPSPAPANAGAPAASVEKPVKSGGYVGFSIITGQGTLYLNGDSAEINDALQLTGALLGEPNAAPMTLGMMLRLGWGTGDLLFGTQFNWIRSFITLNSGDAVGYDFRGFDLTTTWWSQEMGIYARVGVGPAQFRTYAGSSESDPVGGVEFMAGFGATMGGVGVGIDMIRQAYDANEAGFDSVTYVTAGLSLDLY